jgi:hypothetical protein
MTKRSLIFCVLALGLSIMNSASAGPGELRAALEEVRTAKTEAQNVQLRLEAVERVLLSELMGPRPVLSYTDSQRVPFTSEYDCKESSNQRSVLDGISTAKQNARIKCERECTGRPVRGSCTDAILSFSHGSRSNPSNPRDLFVCTVSAEVSCK